MSDITFNVRLRPVRFAFLVKPSDRAQIERAAEINTCLWGGKFNPVIPSLKKTPKWWDRHTRRGLTATQIING